MSTIALERYSTVLKPWLKLFGCFDLGDEACGIGLPV